MRNLERCIICWLFSFKNYFNSSSGRFPPTVSNLFNPVVLEVVISSCLHKHIMWWNPDSQHWKGLCESVLENFHCFQTFLKGALSTFSGSQKYKFLVKYSFPEELLNFFFFFPISGWRNDCVEKTLATFFRPAILWGRIVCS